MSAQQLVERLAIPLPRRFEELSLRQVPGLGWLDWFNSWSLEFNL
jgi:hypothetical protein